MHALHAGHALPTFHIYLYLYLRSNTDNRVYVTSNTTKHVSIPIHNYLSQPGLRLFPFLRLIVNLIIFACAQSPGSFPYRCYRNVASGLVKLTDSKVVLRCCWPRYYSPSPALLSQLVMPDHFFTLNPIDPLRVIVVAKGIFWRCSVM